MKTFIIVNKETLQVIGSYQAMAKDDSSANRSWLHAEPVCKHLELPQGMESKYVMAEMDGDEIVLAHSEDKEAADLEAAWDMLRAKRNQLLAESDFAMLPDVPFNQTKKDQWAAYREALRSLPEEVADPRQEVEFPTKPS